MDEVLRQDVRYVSAAQQVEEIVHGGHECLLVRIWDNPSDVPGEPKFDASVNRHVGQRNIHDVAPGGAMMMAALGGGAPGPALADLGRRVSTGWEYQINLEVSSNG